MLIEKAEFLISCTEINKCPVPDKPEYAFVGRSNVGKSSLLNMLTDKKNLAKISGKPGKTRLINFFLIDNSWYLVDLPGYGYAKVSKKEKQKLSSYIQLYIKGRHNLVSLFVLIDSRLKPQKIDLNFIEDLALKKIAFVIVFTKSDKLSKSNLATNISNYKKELLKYWEKLPIIFISSSVKKEGKKEILRFIHNTNTIVNK